ncbi:MAG: hypothetical protein ACI9UK_002130 [Candidatus Krumholzibacteriia bacterium]|jgi:hypothetical protein
MKRILWAILALSIMGSASSALAQKTGGLAVSYAKPKGNFEGLVGDGYGLSSVFDYPLSGIVDVTLSLGWYNFEGRTLFEGTNVKTESFSMWEFAVGPQVDFGMLYIGAEGGYYTNVDEWGLVPNVGIRKKMIDASLRYKMTEDAEYYAFRLAFFF